VQTFADRRVTQWQIPYGRNLGFLDQSSYFFFQAVLNCTHEAEWILFQTHYFSENLAMPGIKKTLNLATFLASHMSQADTYLQLFLTASQF
jgi:hypothetical protein